MDVHCISRFQTAITSSLILFDHTVVLHAQPANWDCHPAILILVIVNLRTLTCFPTNGDECEQLVLEYQIACVVVFTEEQVWRKRVPVYRIALQINVDLAGAKVRFRNSAQPGYELIEVHRLRGCLNAHDSCSFFARRHTASLFGMGLRLVLR
jgi:hypothetical protein